jgi:RNA-binding protein PNO1
VVENKTGNPVSSKEEAMRIIGEKEEDKNAVMSLFSDVNPKDPLRPIFAPLGKQNEKKGEKAMYRKVNVPSHRLSPLKEHWMALYTPVTKQMKIDMRMNLKLKKVELKTTDQTEDESALQKSADFIQAFVLGFEIQDAVALLRLDDLYLECFEVKDVKQTLRGEHMSRGIGRLAGKSGKTKYTIENATRTRIVIADQHIRILGSFQNIKVARNALCALIMGSPPGKVYSRLRTVTARLAERF